MKLKGARRKTDWRKTGPRLVVVAALITAYAAYWVFTPASIQVQSIAASPSNPLVMVVTLHNPTFKVASGEIIAITTEVDLPIQGTNETAPLQAIPRTYYFLIAPQLSQAFNIQFNSRVETGVQYDITVHYDGVEQTITVTLQ